MAIASPDGRLNASHRGVFAVAVVMIVEEIRLASSSASLVANPCRNSPQSGGGRSGSYASFALQLASFPKVAIPIGPQTFGPSDLTWFEYLH